MIPAGTEVRDDDGKVVAVLTCDLYPGDPVWCDTFVNYAGVPFDRNEKIPPAVQRFLKQAVQQS